MQLEIYKIEDYKNNRKLVYLDEGAPAFCLYAREISKYDLKEGDVIPDTIYEEIISLLSKRARERCLYLLDSMARTERQLRDKLRESCYPEESIEAAIEYCKKKHYIDDADYAERFIASKADKLSKRAIEQKLYEKGIDKETVANAFENNDLDEVRTAKALIAKKYGDISDMEYESRIKMVKSIMSKGFSYTVAKEAIKG